jgi:hypothetical protein
MQTATTAGHVKRQVLSPAGVENVKPPAYTALSAQKEVGRKKQGRISFAATEKGACLQLEVDELATTRNAWRNS